MNLYRMLLYYIFINLLLNYFFKVLFCDMIEKVGEIYKLFWRK